MSSRPSKHLRPRSPPLLPRRYQQLVCDTKIRDMLDSTDQYVMPGCAHVPRACIEGVTAYVLAKNFDWGLL